MTGMKAFAEQIIDVMNKEENGGLEFRTWKRLKNNGIEACGIFAAGNGRIVSPIIYLKPFYDAYRKGIPMEEITGRIRKIMEGAEGPDMEKVYIMEQFESAAQRVMFRLVNADMNRKLLKQVPHIRILDLAVVFCVRLGKGNGGSFTAMVTREMADQWKITPEELWKLALANSRRELPPVLWGSGGMLEEDTDGSGTWSARDGFMYVLSNRERSWGAGCILYPGELKKAASRLGGDLVVLPSSVHETMIFVRTGEEDPELFGRMISEVNRKEVAREEWLSFQAYGYSLEEDRLMLLSEMPPVDQPEEVMDQPRMDTVQV